MAEKVLGFNILIVKVRIFVSLAGSTAAQLTSSLPVDFVDASEVRNMIQMKGFFKGTSNLWHCALNGVTHEDLALCALGGLVDHLSRLMVSLLAC